MPAHSRTKAAARPAHRRRAAAVRLPRRRDARVERWLAEIAASAAGRTLARLLAAHPTLRTLIAGRGGGLALSLGPRDAPTPERLAALLEAEPERRFAAILADAARADRRRRATRRR